jgi:hypothetical protein
VARDTPGQYTVKIKRKAGGAVVDIMQVWIVWATLTAQSKQPQVAIQVRHFAKGKPKVGDEQPGTYAISYWFTQWSIAPAGIYDTKEDIPDLTGDSTQPVPGAKLLHFARGIPLSGGADKRWDASRQGRVRNLFPTVGTNDIIPAPGPVWDNLPNANRVAVDYPTDDTIGNDDPRTVAQDNNPYSDADTGYLQLPDKTPYKNPIGTISAFDAPTVPQFIDAAGANGDTVEMRFHAREFARLQIGNSATANYKNWYRISDFALWRHQPLFKKACGTWVDNGSVSDNTNDGW